MVSVELDPAALEPSPPAAPAPLGPPAPAAVTTTPVSPTHHGGGKPGKSAPEARLDLEVEAPDQARPSAVVTYRVTVEAGAAAPAHDLEVCNRLPGGLRRLAAARARVRGASACWRLATLPAHGSHTFATTARVEATARRELESTTVLRAGNAPTRRTTASLRVRPLPITLCPRPAHPAADPVAQASC